MNFDQLRYFLEAARTEHVGRAAKILAVSPSAVSHAIAGLEEELGVPLFFREGRQIALTQQGKRFQERVSHLLQNIQSIKEEMAAEGKDFPEHLKVAGTHGALVRALSQCLMQIAKRKPTLTMEIHSLRSVDVVQAVAAGELDFGVCFSPLQHPRVTSEVLATVPLGVCLAKNHPLLTRSASASSPFPLRELPKFPYVAAKAFYGIDNCEQHPCLQEKGIDVSVRVLFDSYDTMISCLLQSQGWSLAPFFVVQHMPDIHWFLPQWSAQAQVCGVWPKGRPPLSTLQECKVQLPSLVRGTPAAVAGKKSRNS